MLPTPGVGQYPWPLSYMRGVIWGHWKGQRREDTRSISKLCYILQNFLGLSDLYFLRRKTGSLGHMLIYCNQPVNQ